MGRKKELIIHIGGNAVNFSRVASSVKRSMHQIGQVGRFVGRGLRTAFRYGTIALGAMAGAATAAVRAFAKDEESLERLRGVLRATENAIGVSEERLREFSAAMEQNTIFADEDVNSMNAVLATFQNIKGDNFLKASEAILDMSAALHGTKTSAEQMQAAAMQMGRALNNPAAGMTALGRSGVRLTKDQENLVKQMVRAKDMAGAQGVILDILKSKYGGTAERLRNTFGGSVRYFRNQFGSMLEKIGEGIVIGAKLEGKFNSMGARLRDFAATISSKVAPHVERLSTAIENLFSGGEKREEGKRQLLGMFQDVKTVATPIFQEMGAAMGTAAAKAFKAGVSRAGGAIVEKSASLHGGRVHRAMTFGNPVTSALASSMGAYGAIRRRLDAGQSLPRAVAGGMTSADANFLRYLTGTQGMPVRIVNTKEIKAE